MGMGQVHDQLGQGVLVQQVVEDLAAADLDRWIGVTGPALTAGVAS
jgi:hypothetical protein